MSVYRADHKTLFIHVPKTAGLAMQQCSFLGGSGHKSALDYHDQLERILRLGVWDSIFKWGFVRNPWDRFVSAYFGWLRVNDGQDSFRDFVLGEFREHGLDNRLMRREEWHLHHNFLPQHLFLCDQSSEVMVDFVGRFERIHEGWAIVCDAIGVEYEELPIVNKSDHFPYQEYYDQSTIDIIAEHYADDIRIFGYEFE